MTRDELKIKYGGLSYADLVSKIKKAQVLSKESQREMTEILCHMKVEHRWNDPPKYKKTTWRDWLMAEFNMLENTFDRNRLAWINYAEISEKYNAGLVPSIQHKCGAEKISTVLKAIDNAQKGKKIPLKREELQKFIDAEAKPKTEPPPRIEWQEKYENERKINHDLLTENVSLKGQVEKLKNTVKELAGNLAAIHEERERQIKEIDIDRVQALMYLNPKKGLI